MWEVFTFKHVSNNNYNASGSDGYSPPPPIPAINLMQAVWIAVVGFVAGRVTGGTGGWGESQKWS